MVNIDPTTPQLKVIKDFADAFTSHNLDKAEPLLSKDFVLKTFPKSAELPDLTKEEYLQKYSVVLALLAKIEITFHEVIEVPGKAVVHHSYLFTTVDGTTVDYDSVFVLSFAEEDGELKVLQTKDFSDPEKRRTFHAQVAKLLAHGTPVA